MLIIIVINKMVKFLNKKNIKKESRREQRDWWAGSLDQGARPSLGPTQHKERTALPGELFSDL